MFFYSRFQLSFHLAYIGGITVLAKYFINYIFIRHSFFIFVYFDELAKFIEATQFKTVFNMRLSVRNAF